MSRLHFCISCPAFITKEKERKTAWGLGWVVYKHTCFFSAASLSTLVFCQISGMLLSSFRNIPLTGKASFKYNVKSRCVSHRWSRPGRKVDAARDHQGDPRAVGKISCILSKLWFGRGNLIGLTSGKDHVDGVGRFLRSAAGLHVPLPDPLLPSHLVIFSTNFLALLGAICLHLPAYLSQKPELWSSCILSCPSGLHLTFSKHCLSNLLPEITKAWFYWKLCTGHKSSIFFICHVNDISHLPSWLMTVPLRPSYSCSWTFWTRSCCIFVL